MDWFEDEQFWATFDAYVFPAERMSGADREVNQLPALAGVSRGEALDLCGGPRAARGVARPPDRFDLVVNLSTSSAYRRSKVSCRGDTPGW